jgi:hypothetical protein
MIDLVCLVADKNMEAVVQALLGRPESMGIRAVQGEILVHPRRDPGCFHGAAELLRAYQGSALHALVLMDRAWEGAPENTGEALERILGAALTREFGEGWAEPVVIDPELEAWLFADSPHVEAALGWTRPDQGLRSALRSRQMWPDGAAKPSDPKAAVEFALVEVRRPRSSSIYREIAQKVSVQRCQDRSFLRFRQLLARWFPPQA